MPKKYRLVQTDNQPQELLRVDFNMESSVPFKLPADVQLLIKEMVRFLVLCNVFFWRIGPHMKHRLLCCTLYVLCFHWRCVVCIDGGKPGYVSDIRNTTPAQHGNHSQPKGRQWESNLECSCRKNMLYQLG